MVERNGGSVIGHFPVMLLNDFLRNLALKQCDSFMVTTVETRVNENLFE